MFVCPKCGSDEVHMLTWVNINFGGDVLIDVHDHKAHQEVYPEIQYQCYGDCGGTIPGVMTETEYHERERDND